MERLASPGSAVCCRDSARARQIDPQPHREPTLALYVRLPQSSRASPVVSGSREHDPLIRGVRGLVVSDMEALARRTLDRRWHPPLRKRVNGKGGYGMDFRAPGVACAASSAALIAPVTRTSATGGKYERRLCSSERTYHHGGFHAPLRRLCPRHYGLAIADGGRPATRRWIDMVRLDRRFGTPAPGKEDGALTSIAGTRHDDAPRLVLNRRQGSRRRNSRGPRPGTGQPSTIRTASIPINVAALARSRPTTPGATVPIPCRSL